LNEQGASVGQPNGERHYGLDWLRIAAFGLLIFYHVAMVFAPWTWVIKTSHSYPELIAPMALLTPWRLPLLFAVSGYASRRLFEREADARSFARSRAARLLVPLVFGMAVLVPLEMWVRVMEHGYPHGYARFWAYDYWRWGSFYGTRFPSWEHLWFLAYLAAYTALLSTVLITGHGRLIALMDRAVVWLCMSGRLLWAPLVALVTAKLALLFVASEQQGLFVDWGGHGLYLPVFLFGFAAAGSSRIWDALALLWKLATAVAAAAGAVVVIIEFAYPGTSVPPHALMALDRAAAVVMAWAMIIALFHLADRWLNADHRWRRPLAEAVFPAYLVHHGAIVVLAWYTLPLGLSAAAEFLLLLSGTCVTCVLAYIVGRRVAWLRPLIGLAPRAADRAGNAGTQQAIC
jgi:glucan biosynthesis protein C